MYKVPRQCTRCPVSVQGVPSVCKVPRQCTRCHVSVQGAVSVYKVPRQCTRCRVSVQGAPSVYKVPCQCTWCPVTVQGASSVQKMPCQCTRCPVSVPRPAYLTPSAIIAKNSLLIQVNITRLYTRPIVQRNPNAPHPQYTVPPTHHMRHRIPLFSNHAGWM